jgi:hypothetical protein
MTISRDRTSPPDRPYRSIASQMTPEYDEAVRGSADAELRGDAAEALRLHRSVPFFRQSTHGDRLEQLAGLGDRAPGWLVNRWLTVQARRRVWSGGDEAATQRTLQLVLPLIYPEGIPFERIGCSHPEQVIPFVNELDWVVRQADVYELGALRRLVGGIASPELLERADQIGAWCSAPMRACRVERVDPADGRTIEVLDLATGQRVELLDLGGSSELERGEHLLGRIVPISQAAEAMFDWPALPVTEAAAVAVAADPRRWLTTLHTLARDGRLVPGFSHRPEPSLTSDLPYRAWQSVAGVRAKDIPDRDPAGVVAEAARRALAMAGRGAEVVLPHRHRIGDLVLDPSFNDDVRWRFVDAELAAPWQLLGELVPEHARARCEEMVMWCAASPELPDAIA